jgi:hypothetical protein
VFCTLHEYRAVYGLAGLLGVVTGIVDVAVLDWAVKSFLWAGLVLLYTLVASYEFIVMRTPPRPLLQVLLFTLLAPMGLISIHHYTWLVVTVMLGREVSHVLWLAPGIYASLHLYNVLTLAMLTLYLLYLAYINSRPCRE